MGSRWCDKQLPTLAQASFAFHLDLPYNFAAVTQRKALPSRYKIKLVRSRYAVCVQNEGYEASLEKRKIYQVLPDADATAHHLTRVIDESGEDYLVVDQNT